MSSSFPEWAWLVIWCKLNLGETRRVGVAHLGWCEQVARIDNEVIIDCQLIVDIPEPLAFIRGLVSMAWEFIEDVVSKLLVHTVVFGLLTKVLKTDVLLVLICYCSDFQQRVLWIVVHVMLFEYLKWLRIEDWIAWKSVWCVVETSFDPLGSKIVSHDPCLEMLKSWVFYLIQTVVIEDWA